MQLHRLACQIETGFGIGSGAMIAPGIVITALHVVLGDDPPETTPAGATAKIRLADDLFRKSAASSVGWDDAAFASAWRASSEKAPWHDGELIWPLPGATVRKDDCAIIRAPGAVGPFDEGIEVTAAMLPRQTNCIGFGFPRFTTRSLPGSSQEIREIYTMTGEAGVSVAPKIYSHALQVQVSSSTPDDINGWRGLSGSAVWIDDGVSARLLGVIHDRASGVFARDELSFWPVATISDPDFWLASGLKPPSSKAPAVISQNASPLDLDVREKFIDFDRSVTSNTFLNWLKGDRPRRTPVYNRTGPPKKPTVVVLRGHEVDELTLCAERLANDVARGAFQKHADNYQTPVTLYCGASNRDPFDRADGVLRDWAKRVGLRDEGIDDEPVDLVVEGIGAPDRPRAIILEHDDAAFSDSCKTMLEETIYALDLAGKSDPPPDPPPILFLCVVTGADVGNVETAFMPAQPFPDKATAFDKALSQLQKIYPDLEWVTGIDPLGEDLCRPSHFVDWVDDLAGKHGLETSDEARNSIRRQIGPFENFPMRFARHVLDVAFPYSGD